MGYQTCPVCKGTGRKKILINTITCSVCKGAGIIDELTGKPPASIDIDDNRESQQDYFGK